MEQYSSNVSDQPGTQSGFIISYLLHVANAQRASGSSRACTDGTHSPCTSNHQWRVGVWGYRGWWLRSQPEAGTVTGMEVGGVVIACTHSASVSPWVRIAPGARSRLLWCEMIAFLRSKAHKKSRFLLSHGVWGISKQSSLAPCCHHKGPKGQVLL